MLELSGGDSLLCHHLDTGNVTALGVTAADLAVIQALVNCLPASSYPYFDHNPVLNEDEHYK